jgi:hypothetical protein
MRTYIPCAILPARCKVVSSCDYRIPGPSRCYDNIQRPGGYLVRYCTSIPVHPQAKIYNTLWHKSVQHRDVRRKFQQTEMLPNHKSGGPDVELAKCQAGSTVAAMGRRRSLQRDTLLQGQVRRCGWSCGDGYSLVPTFFCPNHLPHLKSWTKYSVHRCFQCG